MVYWARASGTAGSTQIINGYISKVHLSIIINSEYIKISLQIVVTFQDYSQKSV